MKRYVIIISGVGNDKTILLNDLHKAIKLAKQLKEESNDTIKLFDTFAEEYITI